MIASSACAAAVTTTTTSPSFVLPTTKTTSNHADQQESTSPTTTAKTPFLPIVVWDGLCNCAAQINRLGGNRNAVRTGFLHCAANQDFSNDEINRLLLQDLKEMEQLADDGLEYVPQHSCPFQLWKVVGDGYEDALIPMAPPMQYFGNRDVSLLSNDSRYTPIRIPARDDDLEPIDEVVRMAMVAGCDACIVVSHREEIRELYKHRCNYRFSRRSLPYCCIGRFEVRCESASSSPLKWTMHDVTPFEEVTVDSVRSMLPRSESQKLGNTFELKFPGGQSSSCSASLVLDETLPFTDIDSCTLSGLEMETATNPTGVSVELEIQKGHAQWFDFLHTKQERPFASVVGTVSVRLGDSSIQEKQMCIHAINQPELPCPPKTIQMYVLF